MKAVFGPDSGGRMKGVTISKPVIYGNVAHHFGKKREEDGHTHCWTCYLKVSLFLYFEHDSKVNPFNQPYENEDMSSYVKKVSFKLHER